MPKSVNPATGDTVATYPDESPADINAKLEAAEAAQRDWASAGFEERATVLRSAAEILRSRKSEFATLMATEMGKPVDQGVSEAEKCAWVCDHYADGAAEALAAKPVDTDADASYVAYRPLGIVLAIMPWNFPFWQVFRFAAPNLMAGNAGLLKHAPNVTGCALAIVEIFEEAGLPSGLFESAVVPVDRVGAIIADPRIRAVTLTGSTQAGRSVAEQAGRHLKKTVLELGGSDPYVILSDADLDAAASTCVTSRLINSGQSCIAAKRFIVVEDVLSAFEERVVAAMSDKSFGDPLEDPPPDLGPMARADLRDALHDQVRRSLAMGAELRLGGTVPDEPGHFYPPTVLADVAPGMPAFEEETFGPVAAIVPAADDQEALALANRSAFGLGAAVFTADQAQGERLAREVLEAGCCFVNAYVRSDPRLPFGGIKQSGYGRELGTFGLHEFVNVKTVYVG